MKLCPKVFHRYEKEKEISVGEMTNQQLWFMPKLWMEEIRLKKWSIVMKFSFGTHHLIQLQNHSSKRNRDSTESIGPMEMLPLFQTVGMIPEIRNLI